MSCGCGHHPSLKGQLSVPKTVTTGDYEKLANLPTINKVLLKGDLTLDDLGLVDEEDVKNMIAEAVKDLPAGDGETYIIELNEETGEHELKNSKGEVVSSFTIPTDYLTAEDVQSIIDENIASVDDADVDEMLDEVMGEDEEVAPAE